ncbi:restriction endonuclease subunit S [Clostridium paraputrificum]|uniref:restriction endonuclease subunit S n=1 Tax=Clostridium paraputrificum TaxID=29363 RepID=UPI0011C73DE9|nr:restriction endonuclease subunit S [Clostridium paraputrificum]
MNRKMKNSGIKWIGLIPNEYKIVKVKNLFNIGRGRVISLLEIDDNGEYPVYSSQTKNNGCLGYINTYDFDCSQLTWTTDGANAGTVFLREGKHNCTNVCGTLLPKNNINNIRYLKYALEYIAIFHKRADTNGFKIMNNEMAEIKITLPPIEEQELIANYLDKRISRVEDIIRQTNISIKEYKKYKQAIITEAVTTGVNSDKEMKDSGVDYIGKIPIDWSVKKLRHIGTLQNGISKASEEFGFGYPFISYGDVYRNISLPLEASGLVNSNENERINYSVKQGDVLFTRTSETIDEVGFASTCLRTIDNAVFAGFVIRFRPSLNYLNENYSKYYFRSEMHRRFFVKEMNLVTRASLSQELLKRLPVIIPPKEEQKEIAGYLDNKCIEIDNIIEQKQKLLIEMEAYKKSLIYECVTGKREVK